MGNRVTIQIQSEQFLTPINLYGHWAGEQGLTAVREVLARTNRIGDPSFLTAQMFYEFARLGEYDGEHSFGIDAFGSDSVSDWDNPPIFVNADDGSYWVGDGEPVTEFVKVDDGSLVVKMN
jgi:hypothetical protein